ncbi:MAG: ABC transporter permease [Lachnospiraceae bacterium]|nr:ABC transporter permease [Lachnospiraceae bacterium]
MKYITLELRKIKKTSMSYIIFLFATLPILLMLLLHITSDEINKEFYTIIANYSVIITMCLFTVSIILANYIITREYQESTIIYLFIAPVSRKKILASKFGLLFLILFTLSIFTYGCIFLLNVMLGEVNSDIFARYVAACLSGAFLFFLLMPLIVAIALWRKNFISSMLISLVMLIFTSPFMFTQNFYAFPHLIPMAVSNNMLMTDNKLDINYPLAFLILALVGCLFTFVSVRLFEKKE